MKTKIIYEDKEILIVHKPAGLATQTARVDQQDVVSELKNYLGGSAYLGIIHRLDQPVEGLLAFGKTKAAAASLSQQLRSGPGNCAPLNKRYYCVFCGKAPAQEGQLEDYLFRDATGKAGVLSAREAQSDPRAKYAFLRYRILQEKEIFLPKAPDSLPEETSVLLSLADIEIRTGRFHQIRAQMAHSGMSLLGDSRYGDALSRKVSGLLDIRRAALCAYRLDLSHPVSGKKLHFQITPSEKVFTYFSL